MSPFPNPCCGRHAQRRRDLRTTFTSSHDCSIVSDHRVPHLLRLSPLGDQRPAHIPEYSSQAAFAHLGHPVIVYSSGEACNSTSSPCDDLRSISAIAEGMVVAASVDELVYLHALKRGSALADTLSVLQRSEVFPMPPVVALRQKDAAFISRVRRVFLELHREETGKRVLRSLDIDRFVLPGPEYHGR